MGPVMVQSLRCSMKGYTNDIRHLQVWHAVCSMSRVKRGPRRALHRHSTGEHTMSPKNQPTAPKAPAAPSVEDLLAMLAASGDPAAQAAVKAHADTLASAKRAENAVAIGEAKSATAEQVLAFWRKLRDLDPDTAVPTSDKRVRVTFDISLSAQEGEDGPEDVLTCALAGKVRQTGGGGGGGGKVKLPDGYDAWLDSKLAAAEDGKYTVKMARVDADALLADPECEAGLRAIAERVAEQTGTALTSTIYKAKVRAGLVNGRS